MRQALLFCANMTLVGCGPEMAIYARTQVAAQENPDQLYAAAVRVLLRRGWGFQSRDDKARAVETEYARTGELKFGPGYLEESYRIIISKDAIEVFTNCRWVNGYGKVTSCENERRADTKSREEGLVRDIMAEVRTLASGTPKSSPQAGGDAANCVSICGKDRQSCLVTCGKSEKCKDQCMEGYGACAKACSR